MVQTGEWISINNKPLNTAFITDDGENSPKPTEDEQNKSGKSYWKLIPPQEGESEFKKDTRGRSWWWCVKCHRWTPTHSTKNHVRRTDRTPPGISTPEPGPKPSPLVQTPSDTNIKSTLTNTNPSASSPSVQFAQYDSEALNNMRQDSFRSLFTSMKNK